MIDTDVQPGLKPGDYIRITNWLRDASYVRIRSSGPFVTQELSGDCTPQEGDRIADNRKYFGDILKVVATDGDWVLLDVYTTRGQGDCERFRVTENASQFDYKMADGAFVAEMLKNVKGDRPKPKLAPSDWVGIGLGVVCLISIAVIIWGPS